MFLNHSHKCFSNQSFKWYDIGIGKAWGCRDISHYNTFVLSANYCKTINDNFMLIMSYLYCQVNHMGAYLLSPSAKFKPLINDFLIYRKQCYYTFCRLCHNNILLKRFIADTPIVSHRNQQLWVQLESCLLSFFPSKWRFFLDKKCFIRKIITLCGVHFFLFRGLLPSQLSVECEDSFCSNYQGHLG